MLKRISEITSGNLIAFVPHTQEEAKQCEVNDDVSKNIQNASSGGDFPC